MRAICILIVFLLIGCTIDSHQPVVETDKENESLRMRSATQQEVIKALRQKIDRLEIDLEYAVNKRCVPIEVPKPAVRKSSKKVGLA